MPLQPFSVLDAVALAGFVGAWIGYAIIMEWTRHGRGSLNPASTLIERSGARRMLAREMRMVDMQIMGSLQNGTAFFASTSLLAIGGALTLLRSTDEILLLVTTLPFGIQATRELWEAKTIGLVVIFFAYAFFKFGWSYRLFNYMAILLGAMPFAAEKTRRRQKPTCARLRGCSSRRAAISTAASAPSSSRSAISAGSSVR
jgi:uncharacterized membrane protein